MSTVLTVQANLTGNASSMVSATQAAAAALKNMQAALRSTEAAFDGFGNKIGNMVADKVVAATRTMGELVQKAAAWAATLGAAAVAAGVGFFMAAARVEELDFAMKAVAKSTGISYDAIRSTAIAVKQQGIEMATAQELATQFARANLNLANATKIARVAQDLAVVSGQNSTQVTQQLMMAIVKQDTEMLRSAGITVNAQQAYEAYADSVGKKVKDLSNAEKQQVFLNMILAEGAKVAGVYESAMKSASKVLRSFPRLLNDISVSLGGPLLSAFGPIIVTTYEMVKAFAKAVDVGGSLRPMIDALGAILTKLVQPLADSATHMAHFIESFKLGEDTVRNVVKSLEGLGSMVGPIAALTAGIAAFGAKGIPIIGQFLPAINPLVAAFLALVATSPVLRRVMSQLFDEFKKSLPKLQSAVEFAGRTFQTTLIPAIETLMVAIRPLIPMLANLAATMLTGLVRVLPTVIGLATQFARAITPMVDAISRLPTPVLTTVAALIALQSAGLPVAGIITQVGAAMLKTTGSLLGFNTGIAGFGESIASMSIKTQGLQGALTGVAGFIAGPWGLAIGGAIAILGLLAASAFPQAAANADELTASLDRQTGAFTDATKASVLKALQDAGAIKDAHELGISINDLVDAAMGSRDAQDRVNEVTRETVASYAAANSGAADYAQTSNALELAAVNVANAVGTQTTAVKDALRNNRDWLEVSGAVKDQYGLLSDAVAQAGTNIATTGKVTRDATGAIDVASAAYEASKMALDRVGEAAAALVTTTNNATGSTYAIQGAQKQAANDIYNTAIQMGYNADEAAKLTATYLNVPTSVVTNVLFNNYAEVYGQLMKIQDALRQVTGNKGLHISTGAGGQGGLIMANGGIVQAANGIFTGGRESQIVKGGANGAGILWGEPETGWEAYISGKNSQKQRSASIWAKAGRRLGLMGGGGDTGGVGSIVALAPEDRALLRQIADKDVSVHLGDQEVAGSANRGNAMNQKGGAN